jgi:hypothetical protein
MVDAARQSYERSSEPLWSPQAEQALAATRLSAALLKGGADVDWHRSPEARRWIAIE